jgi:hypothetical protein
VRGVSTLNLQIVEIARSFLLPFSFLYDQDSLHSLLLASIRCLVDGLDDIRGHGKIIIDTSSHIPHQQYFGYI